MLLAFVLCCAPAAAQRVRIPGTQVALEPPVGFTASKRFLGFESAKHQASIMVTQMPAPASEMAKSMTRERLASGGMTLLASRVVKVCGCDATVSHVGQSAAGVHYRKWMLITGDEKTSVLIVGTYPADSPVAVATAVERAVLSSSWSPAPLADPLEGLPFSVRPTAKLKWAGRIGNSLMLTESGETVLQRPTEAFCAVGISVSKSRTANLKQYSEQRLRQTVKITGIASMIGKTAKLGRLPAYEILASAADAKTGSALLVYQVLAPDAGGYYLVQGMVAADRAAEMLPEFQKVAASFRR